MGHKWNGFSDTVPLFRQALLKDTDVDDNDIIFLIDAYDVIIFPALRNAIKVFSESPTPVLMCTEIGLHPEQLGGILYRRGDDSDPAEFGIRFGDKEQPPRRVARFVNGGCAAGRAAQLKELFTSDTIWPHIFYRDDQMDQGRFIMSNPHIASLDDDRELFFTAYKENTNVLAKIATDFGFEMNRHHHRYIGILHCNGGSLPLCER